MSLNWVAYGTCYTKSEGTELGGIEGAETGFSQKYDAANNKSTKSEKPRNPISTPGNSYKF